MRLSGSVSSTIWICAESKPLLVIILKPPFQPEVAQLLAECGPLLAGVNNGADRMEFSEECAVNRPPSVSFILLNSCVQQSNQWVCPMQTNPTGSRKLDTSFGFTDTFPSSSCSTETKLAPSWSIQTENSPKFNPRLRRTRNVSNTSCYSFSCRCVVTFQFLCRILKAEAAAAGRALRRQKCNICWGHVTKREVRWQRVE